MPTSPWKQCRLPEILGEEHIPLVDVRPRSLPLSLEEAAHMRWVVVGSGARVLLGRLGVWRVLFGRCGSRKVDGDFLLAIGVTLCRFMNSNRIVRAIFFVIGVVLGRFGSQILYGQIRDCDRSMRVVRNLPFTTTSRATRSRLVLHGGCGKNKKTQ